MRSERAPKELRKSSERAPKFGPNLPESSRPLSRPARGDSRPARGAGLVPLSAGEAHVSRSLGSFSGPHSAKQPRVSRAEARVRVTTAPNDGFHPPWSASPRPSRDVAMPVLRRHNCRVGPHSSHTLRNPPAHARQVSFAPSLAEASPRPTAVSICVTGALPGVQICRFFCFSSILPEI